MRIILIKIITFW